MPAKPKILVTGATGQVGSLVIPYLTADPNVEVVAGVRSLEKAKSLGVPSVYLDLDKPESLEPALQGVEGAFLATGYTIDMMRQSKDFLNAAKRVGVKHIVHLGACGDNDTRIAHYAWHQFIERYVEWCGFSFTHLRPEIFMQNLLGYGGNRYVVNGVISHYVGKARLSWVDIEDVAAVAAASLLNPDKHHGQTYRMGYEALTCDEIAEIFTKTLGQPFTYKAHSPDEFYASVLAAGAEPAYMKCVHDSFVDFTAGRGEKVDEVFDNLPTILGRQPKTVAEFAKKNADAFRY